VTSATASANAPTRTSIATSLARGRGVGREAEHGGDGDGGDQQARHGPGDREQEALGQQLTYQPRAIPAERRAHRELRQPGHAPSEEQIGEVDAREQEQQRDRAEEKEQGLADGAGHPGPEWLEREGPSPVRRRVELGQTLARGVDLGLGAGERAAGAQTGDGGHEVRDPGLRGLGVAHPHGNEDLRLGQREREARGEDAHHLERPAAEVQGPAEERASPVPPRELVRHDHHRLGAGAVVVRSQQPAGGRRHGEGRQEISAHQGRRDLHRRVALEDVRRPGREGSHRLEARHLGAEVLDVRVRLLGAEGDQRGGTRVGERPEEHPVHEREQGDARADPHRERRHDEGAERPRVTKRAKRRSQVLEESAHVGPASSIHASEVPGTRGLCPVECGNARPTLGRHRPTACRPCPLRP
jgi:hypothetical protein